jgi:hypothetical protein
MEQEKINNLSFSKSWFELQFIEILFVRRLITEEHLREIKKKHFAHFTNSQ